MINCVLFLIVLIQCDLQATIEVRSIPARNDVIIDLSDRENDIGKRWKEDLLSLINGKKERIEYITANEARLYFTDYLVSLKGQEEASQLMDTYFNDKYFGKNFTESDLLALAAKDNYLFTQIYNALTDDLPGSVSNMNPARWGLAASLISPEQAYALYIKKNTWLAKKLLEEGLDTLEKYRIKYPEKADTIFNINFFGVPKDFTQKRFGILTEKLIRDIYHVAKQIIQTTHHGDYIIFFGNTPYFIGRAVQLLTSNQRSHVNYRHVIIFPFTGSPNKARGAGKRLTFDDIVTSFRLEHLSERIRKVGLSPDNRDLLKKKIYLVDVIGLGSGPAYMIEELIRMFQEKHKAVPDINLIALNEIDITNKEDKRNSMIAIKNAKNGDFLDFFFPSIQDTHFVMSGQVIYLPGHAILDNLPSETWRVLAKYSAMFWVPEYDHILNRIPDMIQPALKYFDSSIKIIDRELKR